MLRFGVLAVAAIAIACTAAVSPAAPPRETPRVEATPSPTSTLLFQVGAAQARYVATTVAFFDAFNAGNLSAALALTTSDVVGGDCDPRTARPRVFGRFTEFSAWLGDRAAEHERYTISQIVNENPDPLTGSRVVAVGFLNRSSDVLAAMGRPEGIHPGGAAKIVFSPDGARIVALNLPCQ